MTSRRQMTSGDGWQVTGLTPNSIHPTHFHAGASCNAGGPIIFPLPDLKANSEGIAVTQATIDARSIPATGWYINVHQGPGMGMPLACGLVQPPM